jgi:hypothetical protein
MAYICNFSVVPIEDSSDFHVWWRSVDIARYSPGAADCLYRVESGKDE